MSRSAGITDQKNHAMAHGEGRVMATPDPDPYHTPGLDSRHTLPSGETPPAEGGVSGVSHPEPSEVHRAWAISPLVLIVLVAVVVSAMLIGMIFALSG
ncbi:DUF6480 family protein [Kitasatospora sp. NBC_00085]|uniref:DUF6480 family protein n=1 Tax=unclassified Kitasatospora TaxID=2633591 RepID=UPI0032496A18